MNPKELVGRTITNIFETNPSIVQEGIPGKASYFDIVIEVDGSDLYNLGAHEITMWTKNDNLIPFEKPAWAVQNKFDVIGKRITLVIQRNSEEYYDGSLTLLLENNIILEHQTTNGDQLFIDESKTITTMTDFTKIFTKYSNTDLLKIIDSPDNYQPLAVETAKTILASRQLSDKDIEMATADLDALRQEKDAKTKKKIDLENKAKSITFSILLTVNPIQAETPNSDKIITIISIVFGGLFLFQLYKEFIVISYMFSDTVANWDFSMVLYFLPFIIVPAAAILFFKRKKLGWTLLASFLTYSAVSSVGLFILTLNMQPSGIPALENIFPQTSPTTHLLTLLFFGGTLWTICKEGIREVYTIDKKYMFRTIGIIATLTALTYYGVFM